MTIFDVGDDEIGFNLKRISTNGRDNDALRELDCSANVIGDDVDVVTVVVVVEDDDRTIKSVGGLI